MSLNNFIPTIWSGNFLSVLQKASVFTQPSVVNRNWEGEIKGNGGDRVKITQIGPVTVSDYTKNSSTLTFQTLDDASMFLDINQSKSFSFAIDDVDAAQAKGNVMQLAMTDAAYRMRDTVDTYIASLHAQAGVTTSLGTTAAPLTVTAKATAGSNISIIDFIALVRTALAKANCPSQGRFMVLPPDLTQKLSMASVLNTNGVTTQTQQAMSDGFVGRAFGFDIFESNNLVNTASAKYKVLAGSNIAMTYAEQINSVEPLRLQDKFSDAVKGLMVYGAKVVQPNALACATVSAAAEA